MSYLHLRNRAGFSLLELAVILAVLSAVTVLAIPKLAGVVLKTKAAQCSTNRVLIARAEERFRADNDGRASLDLNELKTSRYLDRVPGCSDKGHYIWISTSTPVKMGCSCHEWEAAAIAESPQLPQAPATPSPTAGWGFSEGSGAYTGTAPYSAHLRNGAAWATGKLGMGISFDGRNDYVHLDDSAALDLSSAGTLQTWLMSPTGSLNAYGGLLHKGDSSNLRDESYSLQFYGANKLRLAVVTASGQKVYLDAPITVAAGQWYNVAATWDASGMKIYVNGQAAASNTTAAVARNTTGGVNIGGQTTGGASSTYFKGVLDEARIYDSALTAEQIAAYYAQTK